MAVDRMSPHKQANGLLKSLIDIFATNIIIKHKMCEYFNVEDHLFVI